MAPPLPDARLPARAGGLTLLSAAAAAVVTLTISVSPDLRFAYYSPAGYVALETTAGLIAALAAFLALGRFRLTGSVADLALLAATGLLSVTMLLFFLGPALTGHAVGALAIWARALGTLLAAVAFAAAAFMPEQITGDARRRWMQTLVGYGATAVAGMLILSVVRPSIDLPDELPASSLARPLVVGPPALLVWRLLAAVAFAVAAVGFVHRCRERGDPITLGLALAMPLGAGAALHNVLFPSPYADFVFASDVYRLSFFAVVLAGALAQVGAYQRSAERLGMRLERERLARDLHDGPVQSLALLQILIDQVAARVRDPAVTRLDAHAAATLEEWRRAVAAVAAREGSLRASIEDAVVGPARDAGADVRVEVEDAGEPDPADREAVVYLVREAVSNAVRHGGAGHVRVTVTSLRPVRMQVQDDGAGFDPRAPGGAGRGLDSMRERARALGGELAVASGPDGTSVAVVTPGKAPDAGSGPALVP